MVKGPKVAEKLIPIAYDFGTRRVPLEANYFEAINRDKENPIERLTETGVQTADGRVHRLDILVLATGFDAGTGALTRIDFRGRDGRSLKDEWREGPAGLPLPDPLHRRRAARPRGGSATYPRSFRRSRPMHRSARSC